MTNTMNSAPSTGEALEANLHSAEEMHGRENPELLGPLNAAAQFHLSEHNYSRAEDLFNRAAAIAAALSPANHEQVKLSKQKLGWLFFLQNKNSEAEGMLLHALEAVNNDVDANEDGIVHAIRSLIYFYISTEQLAKAETALEKLLAVFQAKHQANSYQAGYALISLAVVCDKKGDLDSSKVNAEKAAAIIKDKCAIGYTVDYLSLSEIINLYYGQERKAEALELVACTMMEGEDLYWTHNPVAARILSSLAEYMRGQKKFKQAESIYKRAIAIKELNGTIADEEFSLLTMNLGNMYLGLRKYADAEPLVKLAMKTRVKLFGSNHPSVASCVETYATILRKTKRIALANKLDFRAREIRSECVNKYERELAAAAAAKA